MLIEYEGTRYHGFQIQNDVHTIQGELEDALLKTTGEKIRLHGAGRTDAGVHAKRQVAAFETESELPPETYVKALNFYLPLDIAIKDALEAKDTFDPRRDAISREYRYTIFNSSTRSPLVSRLAYRATGKLDCELMNQGCKSLMGEHDFSAFTNSEGKAKNTTRRVFEAQIQRRGNFVLFDIVANAFLPQQVRRTVGSLIEVGTGKLDPEEFHQIVRSGKIEKAMQVAPPHGLCLIKVNYSNNWIW